MPSQKTLMDPNGIMVLKELSLPPRECARINPHRRHSAGPCECHRIGGPERDRDPTGRVKSKESMFGARGGPGLDTRLRRSDSADRAKAHRIVR